MPMQLPMTFAMDKAPMSGMALARAILPAETNHQPALSVDVASK
jgi:hypothetical protein